MRKVAKLGVIIAYLIPLILLLVVLYFNIVPATGEYVYGINDEINILENQNYSNYTLNGMTTLSFNPLGRINGRNISVLVEGDAWLIDPDPDFEWNWSIDFTHGVPPFLAVDKKSGGFEGEFVRIPIETGEGMAEFNGSLLFDGTNSLKYEFNNYSVIKLDFNAVESSLNFRQLMGDADWKVLLNEKNIRFVAGDRFISAPFKNESHNISNSIILGFFDNRTEMYLNDEYVGSIGYVSREDDMLYFGRIESVPGNYFEGSIEGFYVLEEPSDECYYFDGNTRLVWPNTSNQFENGSFVVYASWKPLSYSENQQIVGHYNWEIWQRSADVRFFTGRMDNRTGIFYSFISANKNDKNEIYAFYDSDVNIAGTYRDRMTYKNLGNHKLWKDYGNYDLSFGKSMHGSTNYFGGYLCNVSFTYGNPFFVKELDTKGEDVLKLDLVGRGKLNSLIINVK